MLAITNKLDPADGVACFTRLYLDVTQTVADGSSGVQFEDPAFLQALDVGFANLFFAAVDADLAHRPIPPPWDPLFARRAQHHVRPLQFALAGMNAHINHDLPLAVVATATQLKLDPFGDTPQRRDFFRVNDLLGAVEAKVKTAFEDKLLQDLDHTFGTVDDAVTLWSIARAREAAWENARLLWGLRHHHELATMFEDSLARLVNMGGRGLLVR